MCSDGESFPEAAESFPLVRVNFFLFCFPRRPTCITVIYLHFFFCYGFFLLNNFWMYFGNCSSKKSGKGKRPGKGGNRYFKSIGLGFKTPREAIEGNNRLLVVVAPSFSYYLLIILFICLKLHDILFNTLSFSLYMYIYDTWWILGSSHSFCKFSSKLSQIYMLHHVYYDFFVCVFSPWVWAAKDFEMDYLNYFV